MDYKQRGYLLFDDVEKDSSLKPVFDACVSMVLSGSAHVSKTRAKKGYPQHECFRVNGQEILPYAVLEYHLSGLGEAMTEFSYEKARELTEALRKLCGWKSSLLAYTLRNWADRVVRNPFFYDKNNSKNGWNQNWVLKPGEPSWQLPEDYARFACYIAISHVKYGASHDSITANEIFGFLTALGFDLPAKLKKYGSGDMPKELMEYKDADIICKANDAFATIKITIKNESAECYEKVLDFLCALLSAEFPRSYSIDFRSPEKNYLPIKKLPKKGVNQLFANAVGYPEVHDKIEQYARLAMKEDEWYNNLEGEHCAMPGTFAVFAIGLLDDSYFQLISDYLAICDGEHQSVHGEFVLAYIQKYGFTENGLKLYLLCENNIQELPPKLTTLYKKRK